MVELHTLSQDPLSQDPFAHRLKKLKETTLFDGAPLFDMLTELAEDAASLGRYNQPAAHILSEVRARTVEALEAAAERGRWISVSSASHHLDGIPQATIREWCRTEKVRAMKAGGEWRIDRTSLLRKAA